MASLLQNVVVSRHPFEYDKSGLSVSGFTRMRPGRLREIIRSEYPDRKPSVKCRVRDKNFMENTNWMWAQLDLYGIDTETEQQQPRGLSDALEIALEDHLLDDPTDHVKAIEARLKRKYMRERLRRTDELLDRYRAGSWQHEELGQVRHSIRADIKRDRRDRDMQASPDVSSSENPTVLEREHNSSSTDRTSKVQAGESASESPSDDLASIAVAEHAQGAGKLGLTSRVTSRNHLNILREQAPSHVEQPQRLSDCGERESQDESESHDSRVQCPSHLEQPQRSLGSCVRIIQAGCEDCKAQLQAPRWNAFSSLSEEANYDPAFFIAKHFLDKSKKHKDQTKTPLPIALTGLSDPKSLARFARNRSVVVRMVPDAYTSTLILGWNGEEVKDIASNFPTKYPELCKKRKADWELSPESRRRKRNAERQRRWQQSKVTIVKNFSDVFHRLPSDDLSPALRRPIAASF